METCAFEECSQEFEPKRVSQIYCSPECRKKGRALVRKEQNQKPAPTVSCAFEECSQTFEPKRGFQIYCDKKCKQASERKKRQEQLVLVVCNNIYCSEIFTNFNGRKSCSKYCSEIARKQRLGLKTVDYTEVMVCVSEDCNSTFILGRSEGSKSGGSNKVYCSKICQNNHRFRQTQVEIVCSLCGELNLMTKKGSMCDPCHRLRDNWGFLRRQGEYDETFEDYKYNIQTYSKNGCEICGDNTSRLVYDHDHKTGKFRAMLCNRHNLGLGQFNDSPEELIKAAQLLIDRRNF